MSKEENSFQIVNIKVSKECLDKLKICSIQKNIKPYTLVATHILEKAMKTKSFDEIEI